MRVGNINTFSANLPGNFSPRNFERKNENFNPYQMQSHKKEAFGFSKEAANVLKTLSFTSLIDFSEYKKKLDSKGPNSKPEIQRRETDDISGLFSFADKIGQSIVPVLNNFENVYDEANDEIRFFSELYSAELHSKNVKRGENTVTILDASQNPLKTAYFSRGSVHIIKDFKNSSVIICNLEPEGIQKKEFSVYLGCNNIESDEKVQADEFYTFSSGKLKRYGKNCFTDLKGTGFYAEEACTFKRNFFESYDRCLTISCGAEYSSELFEFRVKPGVDYFNQAGNLTPVRYVKNKISANGIVIYSTDEILLSRYAAEETALKVNNI